VKDWISGESWPPVKESLRPHAVRIIGERQAASGHDIVEVVEGLELAVGDSLPCQRPETFGRLDLGRVGGQDVQLDAFGDLKVRRDVPSGTIDDQQHRLVAAGADFRGEGSEDGAEQGGVDGVGQEPDDLARGRPHEAVDIEPLVAVMPLGNRAAAPPGPDFAKDRLQAEPLFVKGPDFNRAGRLFQSEFGDPGSKFFLNTS